MKTLNQITLGSKWLAPVCQGTTAKLDRKIRVSTISYSMGKTWIGFNLDGHGWEELDSETFLKWYAPIAGGIK